MQAGLPPPFWDVAMENVCHSRNVQVVGGTSPWFERNGMHFPGQLIPFGSPVGYMPLETTGIGKGVKQTKFGPFDCERCVSRLCVGHGDEVEEGISCRSTR